MNQDDHDIQSLCSSRGITELMHFTVADNLASILRHGLLPANALKAEGISAFRSDPLRRDYRSDCVCLSISFPNYQMFYKYRQKYRQLHLLWIVLVIDCGVLRGADEFCCCNASSQVERDLDSMERQSWFALERAFGDVFDGKRVVTRAELGTRYGLPAHYPTHVQAEVLIPAEIDVRAIIRIAVESGRDRTRLLRRSDLVGVLNPAFVSVEPALFRPRVDEPFWSAR